MCAPLSQVGGSSFAVSIQLSKDLPLLWGFESIFEARWPRFNPPYKPLGTDVQVWGPCLMLRRLGNGRPRQCPSMPLREGCARGLARVGLSCTDPLTFTFPPHPDSSCMPRAHARHFMLSSIAILGNHSLPCPKSLSVSRSLYYTHVPCLLVWYIVRNLVLAFFGVLLP